MSVWGALAGGVVGTVVLTSALRVAQEAGVTRMDIPLLLGTTFTSDRRKASIVGYAIHFANGLLFSLGYYAIFRGAGEASAWFGALLGFAHAAFVGGAGINVLLPAFHPRMGSAWSDAEETPLLEPPGFMLLNYGRQTMVVTLVAHVVYGAIVGWFAGGV